MRASHRAWRIDTDHGPVSVDVLGRQKRPLLILGHGAGGTMEAPLLVGVQERLGKSHFSVARYNFPYSEKGRRAPDKAPVMEQTVRTVASTLSATSKPSHLLLGGKSMGGRMASLAVSQGFAADGLVFLGYPLHPMGKPDELRKPHLFEIHCPMLFISGTRDKLARLDLLQETIQALGDRARLVLLDRADHSLEHGQQDGVAFAADHIEHWYQDVLANGSMTHRP